MTPLTWGDGIYQHTFKGENDGGVNGDEHPIFANATGQLLVSPVGHIWHGRKFWNVNDQPAGPLYPEIDATYYWAEVDDPWVILLVGATHDGTTITAPSDIRYLSRTLPVTGLPLERPYYTHGGLAMSRYDFGDGGIVGLWRPFANPSEWETITNPGTTLDYDRLWTAVFNTFPTFDGDITVDVQPSEDDTTIDLTGWPTDYGFFDSEGFGAPHRVMAPVVKFGTDPIRYKLTSSDLHYSSPDWTLDVSPAIHSDTAAAATAGAVVTFLPGPEVPLDAPFDIAVRVQPVELRLIADDSVVWDGKLCMPVLAYHPYEPRSWYP